MHEMVVNDVTYVQRTFPERINPLGIKRLQDNAMAFLGVDPRVDKCQYDCFTVRQTAAGNGDHFRCRKGTEVLSLIHLKRHGKV